MIWCIIIDVNKYFYEVIALPDYWSHQIAAKRAHALYLKLKDPKPVFDDKHMAEYYFGAQGPDFYYYINRKKPFTKKHYAPLGTHFHNFDVYRTLEMLIDFAIEQDFPEIKAYVAGYLTHYIIDAICHPHICLHSPDSKAHKTYELALDALCMQYYEHMSIHAQVLSPETRKTGTYLSAVWQPIIKALAINTDISNESFNRASNHMADIQEILLGDVIRKKPWIHNFSAFFNYDLSQLMYPRDFTKDELNALKFEPFNSEFMKGVERSAIMLKKFEALFLKNISKNAFLEWLVTSDYLGNPIQDGGK